MLRRVATGIVVAAFLLSPWPAVADDSDGSSYFVKERGPGVDIVLNQQGNPDGGRQVATKPKNSGERPLSTQDLLNRLCTTTVGLTLDFMPDLNTPVCLRLNTDGDSVPVDAAALAQKARDRLDLMTPRVQTSPEAPVPALVGLETWLWVPEDQWRTLTESVSLGGTTVTVTAQPSQTRWDMGEATMVCENPGRVWRKGLGQDAQTPCGYTYKHTSVREPDQKYTISAVLRYRVTWTCDGNCSAPSGALGVLESNPDTTELEVSERQSVVVINE